MPDEKPKPSFGNVQSGGSSTAPAPPANPTPTTPAAAPAAPRTYTVVGGDSLSKIAKKFYGDGHCCPVKTGTIPADWLMHP
jgi:nucleoid-associated protein YgaU